jgi:hypothetical protein
MRVGGTFQNGTYQAWLECGQKSHGISGGFASSAQQLRLAVGEEQALVFAQCPLDFLIARQRLGIRDAKPLGGLQLGVMKVTDAMFAHQTRGFLGDAQAIPL